MIFDDAEDRQAYIDSFGFKIGDTVQVKNSKEFGRKIAEIVDVRPWFFGEVLCNLRFFDDTGSIKNNRFTSSKLVKAEETSSCSM